MAKKKTAKKPAAKKTRKKFKKADVFKEREKLQARLIFLLDEVDDFWYAKRGKHSHINPIFVEYWRLVDIARELYPDNYIFGELDISEATQPNADDMQVLEMDLEKMLVAFELDTVGSLTRLLLRLNIEFK